MKATDLMLNDLVLYRGDVAKVVAITANGEVSLLVDGHIVARFVCAEELSPIPLTPEILEKNGFKECEYWHELKQGSSIVQAQLPHIRMANEGKTYESSMCNYVHQLQHAFKICEIEKEITL